MSAVISALPTLKPISITNTNTGEVLTWENYLDTSLEPLIEWVYDETQRLYNQDTELAHTLARELKGSANSYARKNGYYANHMSLPREIKAKSRLAELVYFKLMSETASYERNPNPSKQLHRFSRTVNLGAVNSQMASLLKDGNYLYLTWKCWDEEYELTFYIPQYIQERVIAKWSLPVVSSMGFIFTVQEFPIRVKTGVIAGVDQGRVQPFTITILNDKHNLVAEYRARPQLIKTNSKRERILKEVTQTRKKALAYNNLGIDNTVLKEQVTSLRSKASRLGDSLVNELAADITAKAAKHNVSLLRIEDLRWVQGKKYGSKWVHGKLSNKIEHTNSRHGITTKRVSARGTSQYCHKCGTPIVHDSKKRTVWCVECRTQLDRDVNAALNVCKNKSYPVLSNGLDGGTCSLEQGEEIISLRSMDTIKTDT